MKSEKLQFKVKNLLLRFWPVIFIFSIWFIFASPYFLRGRVPYASTYQVNFFPPWSSYQKFWGPVKNNAMPDVHTQIYPWKKFTIDTYRSGQVPLWNPYSFSGNPHLANFQSAVFSPFNLLFFILPFIDAWSILVLLQSLLAGLFTYLFVREIGLSRVGSLIGSVAFMFCGFIVVWMAYGTLAFAILYLPLALFAIEKYFSRRSLKFLFLLSLTIPLSFFSGHFQISLYFLVSILLYMFYRGFIERSILKTIKPLVFITFGLFLSFPQLLPSIELYLQSVRSGIFQVGEAIPFQYLITIIAPDFFGNPVTRNDWFGHYAEWASFVGLGPLFLAVYAIARFRSWKVFFFLILGFGSIILAINSPLSLLLVSIRLPVLSTSALSRIIVLFSFSFAVLAGLGFDAFQKDLEAKKAKKTIIGVLILMLAFIIGVWVLILIGKVYPNEWLIVAKRNFILPTALFLGGVIAVFLAMKNKKFMLLLACYFLLVTSFDSFRFAQKWMPFDPKELAYPNISIIKAIEQHIGNGRIFGNIGGEATTYYGIPSIEGYDPLYIGRYGEFIRSAGSGEFLTGERSVVKLNRQGRYTNRVLDLLGVELLFHPVADTYQGWAFPVWEDTTRFSLVYKEDKFQLFRNNFALPRAVLFHDYEVIKDDKEILKRFYSADFDFRKKLILEEKINMDITEGTGSVKIVKYTSNEVKIEVNTTSLVLLFLSDNYYPGWKAKVNGKSSKIYRADYSFRAVIVPGGESIVELSYSPFL